jgi:hypothetical protein
MLKNLEGDSFSRTYLSKKVLETGIFLQGDPLGNLGKAVYREL